MPGKLQESDEAWADWEGAAQQSVTLVVRPAGGAQGQVLITAARYNSQDLTPGDIQCAGSTYSGITFKLTQGRRMLSITYARSSPKLVGELLECCDGPEMHVIDPLVDVNVRGYRLLGR